MLNRVIFTALQHVMSDVSDGTNFTETPKESRWINENKERHCPRRRVVSVWESKTVSFKSHHLLKLWYMLINQTFDLVTGWKNEVCVSIFHGKTCREHNVKTARATLDWYNHGFSLEERMKCKRFVNGNKLMQQNSFPFPWHIDLYSLCILTIHSYFMHLVNENQCTSIQTCCSFF